jgi:putative drug exporter of the RND superfamily
MSRGTVVPAIAPPSAAPDQTRLARWGAWIASHPLRVLATWVMVLVLAVIFFGQFATNLRGNASRTAGSDSAAAADLLRASFPHAARETDLVVLHSDAVSVQDPEFRQLVGTAIDRYTGAGRVGTVSNPYDQPETSISADGHTALIEVGIAGDDVSEAQAAAEPLGELAQELSTTRIEVYFTGRTPLDAATVERGNEDLARAERIGLPVAALVLLVAFGSVVAATVPLVLGLASVLTTFGVLGTISHLVTFDTFVQSAVSMIGIALGIDYCLFMVTRFREELARAGDHGRPARAALIGTVTATAGRAVLYSGTTVMISLSGLFLVRSATVRATTLGMMIAVLVMMAVALTLLPAVLALLGPRVNRLALPWLRRSMAHPDEQRSAWARLASVSMRRPVLVTAVAVAALTLLALPAFGLRYGADTSPGASRDTPAGKGMTRISEAFAPGVIAPIDIVVSTAGGPMSDRDLRTVADLTAMARHAPGVTTVSSVTDLLDQRAGGHGLAQLTAVRSAAPGSLDSIVDGSGRTTVITVVPAAGPESEAAQSLVHLLRADAGRALSGTGLSAHVGGVPADLADIITENDRATPLVIGVVLAASWLLLLRAFRSLLLPVKAIVMNLFSVGAAFGLMVLVFQDGHGAGLLGVDRVGFIQVMIPMMAFALVFGLSMDYEVFMLTRMRESWQRGRDNQVAVRTGIVRTAPVITAAAAIMIVVFISFTFTRLVDLKQLGFMLAVAVFIDATVIRLFLVPALMRLMGGWNWWLPRWLDRPARLRGR